jgi:SAM-dependent methyltransferase
MQTDGYVYMADTVSKFHRSINVTGWFFHERDHLAGVSLVGSNIVAQISEVGLAHPAVEPGPAGGRGFRIQCLRGSDDFPDDLMITFAPHTGQQIEVKLLDLAEERLVESSSARLYRRFLEAVMAMHHPRVVDIGGRDRSDFDRARDFPGIDYVVVDILPGENVGVVADAHELSKHLAAEAADAVISTATFEHLLMPWKAVVEMNRILKPGGLACIISHQTLGLHDMPWDFWRFSADAWDGLLNSYTGFEILERSLAQEMYVIPFLYRRDMAIAEKSAGYEFSGVIARKSGPSMVDWPVPLQEIIASRYPAEVDDNSSGGVRGGTRRKSKRLAGIR